MINFIYRHRWHALGALVLWAGGVLLADQAAVTEVNTLVPSEHPAISYFDLETDDPAARLNRKLASGEVTLEYQENGLGYLPSVLKALNVNPDSQVMVFSKTSFQAVRISPREPRALYFSDDMAVGYVHDSDTLEFAAFDPRQGFIFYTFDNVKRDPKTLSLDRRDVCLQCHHGPATSGVPGIMVASVYPDATGMPYARLGMPVTDHRTRFQDRWGGWYVTGTHGGMMHRGNAVARDRQNPGDLESRNTQNQTDLSKKFYIDEYLQPTSDLVALMVLEHQTRMSNLITRVGWEQRIYEADLGKDPEADKAMAARIDQDIENLVTYMTFADEAKILSPIEGVSTFSKTFPERGPRDAKGRSLRDFDLETRIFKYPLSYMVYSEPFNALPAPVLDRIYQRLYEVLSGADQSETFQRLTAQDRKNVLEILRDTKDGLPRYWFETATAVVGGE